MKRLLVFLLIAAAVVPVGSDGEARRRRRRLPLFTPTCAVAVTRSFRLAADLDCPGTDGIVIGAAGITVDLNGKRLRGDFVNGAGVVNYGFAGVTVRNGHIAAFNTGVYIDAGTDRMALSRLVVMDHAGDGVYALGGSGLSIGRSVFVSNADNGIELDGAVSGASVIGNSLASSGSSGIDSDANSSTFSRNGASANGSSGMYIAGTGNTVSRNRANANASGGFELAGTGTALYKNVANTNDDHGFEDNGTNSVFTKNTANANTGYGFYFGATATGQKNRANNNLNPDECFGPLTCS